MSEYLNEMIGHQVRGTAEWRRQKAEQFREDPRNIRAAEELEHLAAEIDALNGSEIERQLRDAHDSINKVGDWDQWINLDKTVSEELRSIGFNNSYGTAAQFFEWYRDLLRDKLRESIAMAPDLRDQVENDPRVKMAKRAYDEAYAKALAEARRATFHCLSS